jgi:hypothetical protein
MNAAGWTLGPEFPAHARGDHRAPSIPTGRWARGHDACRDCGRTARPHHAGGRCTACYQRERMPAKKRAELRRLGFAVTRCTTLTHESRLELFSEIRKDMAAISVPTEPGKRGSHG